ncbi:hypothetical protein BG011_001287 [Mortierella polycephala]|uniref:ADP/ATP translocase n=1 Tax=Mortierella polycephala TaxID=41804 RepID=A0A9P6Q5R6_9FUNG|nr:hypothetical protein BG011_001287 [Mortierella polycephala]
MSITDYDKQKHGYLKWFVATLATGVATGACTLLVLYPLDFVRTRLANDMIFKLGATQEFSGIIDVFRKTIASDGFLGLYRGYSSAVFQIAVYRACYFILSDTVKPMAAAYFPGSKVAWYTLAYGVTITSGLISYPFDTVSRRMIMATGTNESLKYKSSIQAFSHILWEEGILPLFLGAATNILRSIAAAHILNEHEIFDILRALLMQ